MMAGSLGWARPPAVLVAVTQDINSTELSDMASSVTATAEELPEAAPAVPSGKSHLLAKVNVLAFLLTVIVAECLLAYFYIPSAAETAAAAAPPHAAAGATPAPSNAEVSVVGEESAAASQMEIDLGEFSLTAFQPASNSTLRIDFHLFGTIAADTDKEFARLMEENKHRIREQVLVTVRSAEITDLTDAGLGLLKRRILDKTNRILGKPLLRSVVFSDFCFVEQ